MKRLLIAASMLAFASAAHGLDDKFESQTYRLNGELVQVWTDANYVVEIRYVPGWQLTCPKAQWGEECGGGQGYLIFEGTLSEFTFNGMARLQVPGCREWFDAYGELDNKTGRLTIYPQRGLRWVKHQPASSSKCKVVLHPAIDPREPLDPKFLPQPNPPIYGKTYD